MEAKELRKRLATVDALLARITVNGDALMLLAVARQELANIVKDNERGDEDG